MRVLVTGATGLVGKELVLLLHKNGIHVNYLTTSEKKLKSETHYKGFFWNPEKGIVDADCLEGVDAVIHLAGASISKRWTKAYKKEIIESRILSTNVLHTLLTSHPNSVKHFISASAIGIYPDSLTDVYSEEETKIDNSFLGEVVQQWEGAAKQIEALGIKLSIIRTGIVLSGKGGALPQMAGPVRLGLGSAFGTGKQMQSWIHIEDLVNIYYYVYTKGLEGIYNAVAPYPVSNGTLMKSIAAVLNKPYFMPKVPKFVFSAILGEMHLLLFTSQNVSAEKILGEGYHFRFLSLDNALKDTLG